MLENILKLHINRVESSTLELSSLMYLFDSSSLKLSLKMKALRDNVSTSLKNLALQILS